MTDPEDQFHDTFEMQIPFPLQVAAVVLVHTMSFILSACCKYCKFIAQVSRWHNGASGRSADLDAHLVYIRTSAAYDIDALNFGPHELPVYRVLKGLKSSR